MTLCQVFDNKKPSQDARRVTLDQLKTNQSLMKKDLYIRRTDFDLVS